MWKLDLSIWNVNEHNNWVIFWGIDSDVLSSVNDISSAASQVLSPAKNIVENTIDTLRHPINNIINPKIKNWSYTKLLKFVPATVALAATQALDKPFATVEKAMEYVVNNNIERAIWFTKWITSSFLANIVTSNWETDSKTAKWLWNFIEWTWEFAWSIIKSPFWLAEKALRWIRNTKWYGLEPLSDWSTKWMKELQISNKDYLRYNLINENTTNLNKQAI